MQEAPSEAVELNKKGQGLVIEGKLEEALAALNDAIVLGPAYVNAYLNRAEVLEKLGRVGEAQADRQTARALTAAGPTAPWPAPTGAAAAQAAAVEAMGEERDVAGPGRYILNFFLAGVIGLALTYFLRYQGWLATWICVAILVAVVVLIAAAGA
jgi:tetratricopeptide (TPR) repeat protein